MIEDGLYFIMGYRQFMINHHAEKYVKLAFKDLFNPWMLPLIKKSLYD